MIFFHGGINIDMNWKMRIKFTLDLVQLYDLDRHADFTDRFLYI